MKAKALEQAALTCSAKHKIMLLKLKRIHNKSATDIVEDLIKKEAATYGLIESRELPR
jgi:hypothetical protein